MIDGYWLSVRATDERANTIFTRHYSYGRNGKRRRWNDQLGGPGEKMVLLSKDCMALWVWSREQFRHDGQQGVNCAVFRNEGSALSSALVVEATEHAWNRWPGSRLFTFVDSRRIRSSNPGYCFLKAGWRRCGETKYKRLTILERLPEGA